MSSELERTRLPPCSYLQDVRTEGTYWRWRPIPNQPRTRRFFGPSTRRVQSCDPTRGRCRAKDDRAVLVMPRCRNRSDASDSASNGGSRNTWPVWECLRGDPGAEVNGSRSYSIGTTDLRESVRW